MLARVFIRYTKMIGPALMDHRDIAVAQLAQSDLNVIGNPVAQSVSALAHAVIAACDRIDAMNWAADELVEEEDDS